MYFSKGLTYDKEIVWTLQIIILMRVELSRVRHKHSSHSFRMPLRRAHRISIKTCAMMALLRRHSCSASQLAAFIGCLGSGRRAQRGQCEQHGAQLCEESYRQLYGFQSSAPWWSGRKCNMCACVVHEAECEYESKIDSVQLHYTIIANDHCFCCPIT